MEERKHCNWLIHKYGGLPGAIKDPAPEELHRPCPYESHRQYYDQQKRDLEPSLSGALAGELSHVDEPYSCRCEAADAGEHEPGDERRISECQAVLVSVH